MNVNCAIFETIYNMMSEYTFGLIIENAKEDFLDVVLYQLDCDSLDINCIFQANC